MAVTKSDILSNETTGMENKTVIVTTILVNIIMCELIFDNFSMILLNYQTEGMRIYFI